MKIIKKYAGMTGFSTLDPATSQYLADYLATAKSAYQAGDLAPLAGFNPLQQAAQSGAIDVATGTGGQADVAASSVQDLNVLGRIASGEEVVPASTGATDALKAGAVRSAQQALAPVQAAEAATGQVGGGRQQIQAGEAASSLAGKLAGIDYADLQARRQAAQTAATSGAQLGGGVQTQLAAPLATLSGAGKEIQTQDQKVAEQKMTALQNLSSAIRGTPWQSQQQLSLGGK